MTTILTNPFKNKGTAFTKEERKEYGLTGLLPEKVESIEEQAERLYKSYQIYQKDYEKHKFLMDIYETNRTLFYYLIGEHVTEMLPIIYTPTIADAVMEYSTDFKTPRDAAFLSVEDGETIKERLEQASEPLEDVKLLVITDGEGVLGIGDWGVQGGSIAIGKLAVYTAAAGIQPNQVLPVIIDAGTNNQQLLDDPNYLGLKEDRLSGEAYLDFIDQVVQAGQGLFGERVLFHWEDFGRDHAATILNKYKDKITTFNDDIQGTGIMMAAAVESVVTITEKPLSEHKILVYGAGTAGVGITDQLLSELTLKGVDLEEAKNRFYLFDRYGLITEDMENLTEGQKKYARSKDEFSEPITDLEEAVKAVNPTILIGTSGQSGAFSKEIVTHMAETNERPAILPISNPSKLQEAQAEDIIRWTGGKGLVVTGSPSDPVEYNGTTYTIGQANNALLYPGLGFGIVLAQAERVTDHMLSQAASGIVSLQNLEKPGAGLLPPVAQLREASTLVAAAVIDAAIKDGVSDIQVEDAIETVKEATWTPEYR